MLKEPQIDENAPWKERYRIPVAFGRVACLAPERGLVASDMSGVFQLYSWNVLTGARSQLTNRPEGVRRGTIAPDGGYIYYHHDRKGDEVAPGDEVPEALHVHDSHVVGTAPRQSWHRVSRRRPKPQARQLGFGGWALNSHCPPFTPPSWIARLPRQPRARYDGGITMARLRIFPVSPCGRSSTIHT